LNGASNACGPMIANLAPQNQQAEALLFGLANVMGER
jgi:hypothetical protein